MTHSTQTLHAISNAAPAAMIQNQAAFNKEQQESNQTLIASKNKIAKQNYESSVDAADYTAEATKKDADKNKIAAALSVMSGVGLIGGVAARGVLAKGSTEYNQTKTALETQLTSEKVSGGLGMTAARSGSAEITEEHLSVYAKSGGYVGGKAINPESSYSVKDGKLVEDAQGVKAKDIRTAMTADDEVNAKRQADYVKSVEKSLKSLNAQEQRRIDERLHVSSTLVQASEAASRAGTEGGNSIVTNQQAQDQKNASLSNNSLEGMRKAIDSLDQQENALNQLRQQLPMNFQALNG